MLKKKRRESVALAGAGSIAVVHALAAEPAGLTVTAVASRGGTSARHLAGNLDARRVGPDSLPSGADILVVATPPRSHEEYVARGLAGGAKVLVEKPLTTTLAAADHLVRLATDPGSPAVFVAENLLSSPYWLEAVRLRSTMGPLQHLSASVVQGPPEWGHFLQPLQDGGALFDLGPHPLALVLGLAGSQPVSVSATMSSTRNDGADDDARVRVTFADGLTADLHVSWTAPDSQWAVQAASDGAVVRLEFSPEPLVEFNGEPVTVVPRHHAIDPRLESHGYVDQLLGIAGDPPHRGQSVESARDVLEVICAAYASAGRGGIEVALPFEGDRTLTPMQLWRGRMPTSD